MANGSSDCGLFAVVTQTYAPCLGQAEVAELHRALKQERTKRKDVSRTKDRVAATLRVRGQSCVTAIQWSVGPYWSSFDVYPRLDCIVV